MKFLIFLALIVGMLYCTGSASSAIVVSRPLGAWNNGWNNGWNSGWNNWYGYNNYAYRYPQYGYRTSGPLNVGYTSYARYPSYAYTGSYYPYVSTLGGYHSYAADPAWSNVVYKKK